MKIEQIINSCLSEITYFIQDSDQAIVIDPLRNPDPYIDMANNIGAEIKYVFLTHFHADFVSGHIDLAEKTGATIVCGPGALADFDFYEAKDEEIFNVGNISLKLLHTPGHTLESSSYLLLDENNKEHSLFTGDCIFIGDVGRPDLAVIPGNTDLEDLAEMLYFSIHNKILSLPDDIIIYPNHSKGSACGKNIEPETFDTLKNQIKTNYALNPNLSKHKFIELITEGLNDPPVYFKYDAILNKQIIPSFNDVLSKANKTINTDKFLELAANKDYLVVDTRSKLDFLQYGTIKNAIFIGNDGDFCNSVGNLIDDINQKIICIIDDNTDFTEIITKFAWMGYDNIIGYLEGGFSSLSELNFIIEKTKYISDLQFKDLISTDENINILDVRKQSDYEDFHIDKATNISIENFLSESHRLDQDFTYYIYCNSGYRSLIITTLLKKNGFNDVINVSAALEDIKKTLSKI
ncbi:MAG: MBL fold metallo-hydrolase [Saprospiraceae bacterium]